MSVDIRTTLQRPATQGVAFEKMAEKILGTKYELSLVICGDILAQRMNREYRQKAYKPNVLSFPLSKNEGEIFLNVRCAERESRKFGIPLRERIALLFVHGCFHLKGLDHGNKMESSEQRILKAFRLAK
jgi:probable rRNA maturation factor